MKTEEENLQTELANELFELIYEQDELLEKFVLSLQKKLNRLTQTKNIDDHGDVRNLLISELYNRLSHAKVSTLQKYSNDNKLIKKLLSGVVLTVSDNEKNGGKIYETVKEEVTSYDWKTDTENTSIQYVRHYAEQVSFDFTNGQDDLQLTDVVSVDDIKIPEMRYHWKKESVQVLKNVDMFSKPMRGFVAMLFTEGSEKTQELLEMSVSRFNQTIARLENWIEKHRDLFDSILTYDEQQQLESLTDMAHFNNLLSVAESETVQRWIVSNTDKEWVKLILDDYVDNADEVIVNWDKPHHRKNSYMFVNAIADLENEYSEMLK